MANKLPIKAPADKPVAPAIRNLSGREEIFCYEYIKDLNSTAAARRAGYAIGQLQGATKILYRPEVQAKIKELKAERLASCAYDAKRILDEVASIALADINSYIAVEDVEILREKPSPNGKGKPKQVKVLESRIRLRPWYTLDTRAVNSVKETAEGISFKMNDKIKALELLGRHAGIFKDGMGKDDAAALGAALMAGYNRMLEKKPGGKPNNP